MRIVELKVFCPLNKRELSVYCYPSPNGRYLSNGCDELNGSSACRECCAKTSLLAEEMASSLENGNFVFNQP